MPRIIKISSKLALTLGLFAAIIVTWQIGVWTYSVELQSSVKTGEERLSLYAATLRGAISRYSYLPFVLANNESVKRLFAGSGSSEEVNLYLAKLNQESGSAALFVMDENGTTLASSNWREALSFVGNNYSFRPYFAEAIRGKHGQFFAIGSTTGLPGYFMSQPIFKAGRVVGVAAVKIDLDPLQKEWREGGEIVMVSDSNGVVFLASRDDWKYRALNPLTSEQREAIRARKQYGDNFIEQVPIFNEVSSDKELHIVRAEKSSFLMLSRALPTLGWELKYLASLTPVHQKTLAVATIGGSLSMLLLALSLFARERQQKKLSRRKAQEAEAIYQVNRRLKEEVEEHRRTELALRSAQTELVQSSKLAALGKMAAGIVHELNQPIAAIRTHAASGRLLLDRKQTEQLHETLAAMSRITEHMASITAQLKSFASKTPVKSEKIVFQNCLETALGIVKPMLEESNIELQKQVPEEPLYLYGSCGQIEQVLVNLIRNGVDAVQNSSEKTIRIELGSKAQQLELRISDNGPGIPEENLDELFNPFFTTKEVGQGLGLGLSICYRIINDLGGSISVANIPESGAVFTVKLPLLSERTETDDD